MFESKELLKDLSLESLTLEQVIQEIQRVSADVLPDMASGYNRQRLRAISILAGIAAERLREGR